MGEPTDVRPVHARTDDEIVAAFVGEVAPYAAKVTVDDYDPGWVEWYGQDRVAILEALGDRVIQLEHVGSTSVPDLPAKPIVDVLLAVSDPADEADYRDALVAAGFRLRIREPDWYEHRVFTKRVGDGDHHGVNLHVFSAACEEIGRMLAFRDWLRGHDSDRDRYAEVKRELARRDWKFVQNYADAKTEVIEEIRARISASSA